MRLRLLVMCAATVLALPRPSACAVPTLFPIAVRVYDTTQEAIGTEQRRVLEVAGRTLETAGVRVIWHPCNGTRCDRPVGPNELSLRVVSSSANVPSARFLVLGEALIDLRAQFGALATVFVDRVRALARRALVNRTVLMGRAIAHELGHLLLASGAHGSKGLMRAEWSQRELWIDNPRDWTFTPAEADVIMKRVRGSVPPEG